MHEKPKVLILSGFLGSGKTTVLVQIIGHLRAKHGDGYRIAIIENEIGSASVDSSIVQEAGYSVTEMLSGCVCCTLIGQLVPALEKLDDELHPDLIILEATGMATPGTMRDSIVKYGGYPTRIVVVADASRWKRIMLALRILLEGQAESADVFCVNKTDLVGEDVLEEVERDLRAMNDRAPQFRINASGSMDGADLDAIVGE